MLLRSFSSRLFCLLNDRADTCLLRWLARLVVVLECARVMLLLALCSAVAHRYDTEYKLVARRRDQPEGGPSERTLTTHVTDFFDCNGTYLAPR